MAYAADVLHLSDLSFRDLFSRQRKGRVEAFRVITRQVLFTGAEDESELKSLTIPASKQ